MGRFYVYELVDPRDDKPFYIGKGKGRRAWHHASAVRKGRNSGNERKDSRIREIQSRGMEPQVKIVARFENEQDAFDCESRLIAEIPGLTNILAGGGGWALTPEEAERREQEKYEKRWLRKMKPWLSMVDSWPNGGTFPGLKNGDALAQQLVDYVRARVEAAS